MHSRLYPLSRKVRRFGDADFVRGTNGCPSSFSVGAFSSEKKLTRIRDLTNARRRESADAISSTSRGNRAGFSPGPDFSFHLLSFEECTALRAPSYADKRILENTRSFGRTFARIRGWSSSPRLGGRLFRKRSRRRSYRTRNAATNVGGENLGAAFASLSRY